MSGSQYNASRQVAIGGGGSGIEVDPTTILWISEDGTSWPPLDVGFMSPGSVHTAGNFIYVIRNGVYWVGEVDTP